MIWTKQVFTAFAALKNKDIYTLKKYSDRSQGRLEGFLFNSYYTEFLERAINRSIGLVDSVRQWPGRLEINHRSSHAKENGTWRLLI